MTTNFPASQDTLADPTPSTATNAGGFGHAELHSNENDAIEAIEGLILSGTAYPIALVQKTDAVGGDLSGTATGPSVVKIQGRSVSSAAPSTNQILLWNGSAWTPTSSAAAGLDGTASDIQPVGASASAGSSGLGADAKHVHVGMSATSDLSAIATANATAGNVAMNSHKITGLSNGTASSDGAAFGQIPTSAASIGGMLTATYDPAAIAQQVVGTTATQTVTNKRVTRRVLALSANSATPTINTDSYDVVHITGQTAAITSFTSGLSGTPVDGDELRISVTGTASVALTFGASFESSTVTLPTTTSGTARLDMSFLWNTETSKWRCVGTA